MSVEQTPEEVSAAAQAATDASNAEWQGKIDTLMADNERLSAKISESNKHTKAAETKAAKEEKERLEAASNFEQLYRSSEERHGVEKAEWELKDGERDKKEASGIEQSKANALAERMTKHTGRAKQLAQNLKPRYKYTSEGLKITDINGNLTVSTEADLEREFRTNPDYDFLIDGVDSSGGSATGSNNSGSAGNVYTRAQFEALNPAERMRVSLESRAGKAKIVDER